MSFQRLIARRVADGIHSEIFSGRITLENGFITAVERGDFIPEPTDRFFDEDKLICPAFIDAHGHSDISLFAMKEAQGKTAQGIAFEISGNCGLSPFPLSQYNCAHLQELYQNYNIRLDWHDYADYMYKLKQLAPQLELFPQVGHNTLRACVAGYEKKHLSGAELSGMCHILDRELAAGAVGLSAGLLYVPGCFAGMDELIALLKVVAKHDKVFSIHLRSEGNELENALAETLEAARCAGLKKLHLSHLKTAGEKNFHKINAILEALASPDLCVTGDVYCYNASMTQLSVILPSPFDEYDDVRLMQILRQSDLFTEIRQKMLSERPDSYWEKVRIISAAGEYSKFNGMLLSSAAEVCKISPVYFCLKMLAEDVPGTAAAFHTLSLENMEILTAHPSTVPGSDESARNLTKKFGSSQPRGFGNHAEYFALRRKQGAELGAVISEMSHKTAQIFNLPHIGSIIPGNRAVFTVIEPEKYRSTAAFAEPHSLAEGAEILRFQE
ncbi:MAG: hypothetical protein J6Q81_02720 [Lentisphaeria bacterium]|nr:hypothetical protein [Lentisphaeria bacterium]